MPIAVQLPGYDHRSPGAGLADVINTIGQIRQRSQQADLMKAQIAKEGAQTEGETLKNQMLKSENEKNISYQQALSRPDSVETKSALNDLIANATIHKEVGQKLGLSPQSLQPFDQVLDAAKNGYVMGQKPLPDGQMGPQEATIKPMTGLDAIRAKDSPLFKGIESMYEAKLKGDANITSANIRTKPQEERNQTTANSSYSHEFGPMDGTINSANRVLGIINRIKSGELKSTPTLTTDLSNALGQMFNNGKAATVSGSEHAVAGMTSFEGNAASKYGYLSGQPMNTVTGPQLDQLGADVNALRSEYIGARKNAFDSWIEGQPESQRSGLTSRFNKLSGTSAAASAPKHDGGKQPPGGHMTVEQGGHTYNWNSQTGKYE